MVSPPFVLRKHRHLSLPSSRRKAPPQRTVGERQPADRRQSTVHPSEEEVGTNLRTTQGPLRAETHGQLAINH